MPSRYADVSHSGKTDVASTRTPNSLVWGTTKAIELVSSVRFSWDNHQNRIFIDFLKAVGPDLKDVDIEPLLFQLDLHGYDNIRNKSGESVYRLIKEKVMRKLKRTADKMEMNGLFESDIELVAYMFLFILTSLKYLILLGQVQSTPNTMYLNTDEIRLIQR